jgi:alpha-tubulin suppressor-like RCC1 family protein
MKALMKDRFWRLACSTLILALCGGEILVQAGPSDTAVLVWGNTSHGEANLPGGLTNVVAIAAGEARSLVLKADHTVVSWGGSFIQGPTNLPADLTNITAIDVRQYHFLALRDNGTVVSWGDNAYCGNDPQVQAGVTNAVAIAAGDYYNLVLKADGTLATWGCNNWSQTNVAAQLSNVVAIAAGVAHSLALEADGTVVAWGSNSAGQTNVPTGLTNVAGIAAGAYHSLALKADGTVVSWGDNAGGQLNVPAGLTNVVSISGGDTYSLALKADGTLVAWGPGYNTAGLPSGLTNISAIAAGGQHTLALVGGGAPYFTSLPATRTVVRGATVGLRATATGALPLSYQWQLDGVALPGATNAVLTLTNVQPEQAGSYSVIVTNTYGQTASPGAALTVLGLNIMTQPKSQQSFVGADVTLSVGVAGPQPIYYQWRFNGSSLPGQTNDSLTLTNLQLIQSGPYSVVVSNAFASVTSSPAVVYISQYQVRAWGTNLVWGSDVPQDLDLVAIGAGFYYYMVLRSDGTLVTWGPNNSVTPPAGLSNVVAIASGVFHSLALTSDHTVVAWGENSSGQTDVPASLTDAVAVGAGQNHSLALQSDGTVFAWGLNSSGQANVPPTLSNVVAIAAGGNHSLALRADGIVIGWGDNNYGQTSVPAGLSNVVAIAGGDVHSMALKADGTVAVWGGNGQGQTNMPSGLANVKAIAAGAQNSLALKADGTVVAWGDYGRAGLQVPADLTNVVAIVSGNGVSMALLGNGPPFSTSLLVDRAASAGTSIALRATAVGSTPLDYHWQLNGNDVPQATNAILSLVNVQPSQAGAYSVVVTNARGKSVSASKAMLTVISPVNITAQPVSVTTNAWANVVFGVSATATAPTSYQWYYNNHSLTNGGRISGATSASLTISNAQPADGGSYFVVVSAAGISITSAPPVLLTVPQPARPNFNPATITRSGDGSFHFTLAVDPGSHFEIQVSTNLLDWVPLTNVVSTGSSFPFTDAAAPDHRFYRAKLVQP